MSNATTGIWSAVGALVGGVTGAYVGKYAAQTRPRHSYNEDRGSDLEDAMIVGGAIGSVAGAFLAGTVMSEPKAPEKVQVVGVGRTVPSQVSQTRRPPPTTSRHSACPFGMIRIPAGQGRLVDGTPYPYGYCTTVEAAAAAAAPTVRQRAARFF